MKSTKLLQLTSRWLTIAASFLACALASLAVSLAIPNEYSARAILYISTPDPSANSSAAYQGSLLSEQRVKSYSALVKSPRVAADVNRRLGTDESLSDISDALTPSAQADTVLLTIAATERSQQHAQDVSNAAADSLTLLVSDLEKPSTPQAFPQVQARVVQPATFPTSPDSPRVALNVLLGAMFGLALGVAAALVQERMDRTVKSAESLGAITGAPVLTEIPENVEAAASLTSRSHTGPFGEALKRLRTNLQFVGVDRSRKVVALTSSIEGEGKTTVVCNLALASADAGQRTLVIDGDLRRPRVAEYLKLGASEVGLSTVLAGRIDVRAATQWFVEGRFHVLTSGAVPPNPGELLGSNAMVQLLYELSGQYDQIIVDAPPLLPVADALSLAKVSDGVLLLCRYGLATIDHVDRAAQALKAIDCIPLGIMLTAVPKRTTEKYGNYGYYEKSISERAQAGDSEAAATTAHPLTSRATQLPPSPVPRSQQSANGHRHSYSDRRT